MGGNEATGWLLMKGRFATVPSLHALSVFIAFMPLVFGTTLVITITIHPIMLISMDEGTEGRSLSNISNFANGNLLTIDESDYSMSTCTLIALKHFGAPRSIFGLRTCTRFRGQSRSLTSLPYHLLPAVTRFISQYHRFRRLVLQQHWVLQSE